MIERFKARLGRLKSAGPGTQVQTEFTGRAAKIVAQLSAIDRREALRRGSGGETAVESDLSRKTSPVEVPPGVGLELREYQLAGEPATTVHGEIHVVRRQYAQHHAQGTGSIASALRACSQALSCVALDRTIEGVDFRHALYFDTETTGLSGGTGTLPFLIGVAGFDDDGGFDVHQWVLRRPGEERPMLACLAERIARATCVVSYNGKSFDWPLIRTRFVMNRMEPPRLPVHIDLLHCARRAYRARLPKVSLTTVEREVFGMHRVDDVAGAEIPARYQEFLRTKRGGLLNPVIEHNAHDLVSLAVLLGDLSKRYRRDPSVVNASDSLGLAKTALRAKDFESAHALALAALSGKDELAIEAEKMVGLLHKKKKNALAAVEHFRRALELGGENQLDVHLSLAKLYEHEVKDYERALYHATCLGEEESPRRARLFRKAARQSA